jgi:hypothetical protein
MLSAAAAIVSSASSSSGEHAAADYLRLVEMPSPWLSVRISSSYVLLLLTVITTVPEKVRLARTADIGRWRPEALQTIAPAVRALWPIRL